jgi:prepilin-type N-terminal cleavage/methylation domain-containing protein
MSYNKDKGFTLVELLVVLAIIGVLVGLAIGGMRIVQQVNRDTQRKSFISKDVQLLLEAHQDRKNRYPEEIDISEGGSGNDCGENEMFIESLDGDGDVIEKICSKVNFDVIYNDDCDDFKGQAADRETESGNLTMCYVSQKKGYELYVNLERSTTPYNASNVEVD